jgi:hypothetical protein
MGFSKTPAECQCEPYERKISDRCIQKLKIRVPQRSGGHLEQALRQPQPQQSTNKKLTNAAILVAAFAPSLISALTASLEVPTRRRSPP